ncbi:MAG: F0F1 ATP synthase subunit epsilon [Cellvibrionaceae bacterium]|nr:F0F1 ATP synthase subunit epsilon [Cellvibrionaceae bacterium]
MATTIHCDIVSAEEQIFSGAVASVVAAGTEGDLGIHPGHTPLLSGLRPGPVRLLTAEGGEEIFYISSGYLEVQPYHVTILADTALRAGDMDEAAAQRAKEDAQKHLANQSSETDYSAAAIQLAQAAAQLRTLQSIKKKVGK